MILVFHLQKIITNVNIAYINIYKYQMYLLEA